MTSILLLSVVLLKPIHAMTFCTRFLVSICVPPNNPITACGATSFPGYHSFPKGAIGLPTKLMDVTPVIHEQKGAVRFLVPLVKSFNWKCCSLFYSFFFFFLPSFLILYTSSLHILFSILASILWRHSMFDHVIASLTQKPNSPSLTHGAHLK